MLDFNYFEKNYRLIAADLSKQKALDADSRAIQQIIFTGKIKLTVANAKAVIFKRNNIRIFERNNKSFVSKLKILDWSFSFSFSLQIMIIIMIIMIIMIIIIIMIIMINNT